MRLEASRLRTTPPGPPLRKGGVHGTKLYFAGDDRGLDLETGPRLRQAIHEQIGRMAGAKALSGESEEPRRIAARHVDRFAERRSAARDGVGHTVVRGRS